VPFACFMQLGGAGNSDTDPAAAHGRHRWYLQLNVFSLREAVVVPTCLRQC